MVYHYKVQWDFDGKLMTNEGFGIADNFSEAMTQLSYHFGEQDLYDVSIRWFNEDNLLDFEALLNGLVEERQPDDNSVGPQIIAALQDLIANEEEAK